MSYEEALRIFGFKSHPTERELRDKHRKLIRENHPDRHANKGEEVRKNYENLTKRINQAKDIIEKYEGSSQSHYQQSSQSSSRKGSSNRGSQSRQKARSKKKPKDSYSHQDDNEYNSPYRGQDTTTNIDIPFRTGYYGGNHEFMYNHNGFPKPIKIKIAAQTKAGTQLRVKGYGRPGGNGGPPGDLYVTINVLPPARGFDQYGYAVMDSSAALRKVLGLKGQVPVYNAQTNTFITNISNKQCDWNQYTKTQVPGKGYPGDPGRESGDLFVNTRYKGSAHVVRPMVTIGFLLLTLAIFVSTRSSDSGSDFEVPNNDYTTTDSYDSTNSTDPGASDPGTSDPATDTTQQESQDVTGSLGDDVTDPNADPNLDAPNDSTGDQGTSGSIG